MPNYTSGSTRVILEQPELSKLQANGSVVLDSRRTRPLWFDGRFLAARDLEREQNYFLQREADLGQGAGFENITGLHVENGPSIGQAAGSATVILRAGYGYTPAGELVTIPADLIVRLSDIPAGQSVDAQFGITTAPAESTATRTGLYVLSLRPVEYTGDSITAFPTTIQGSRTTHDGDLISATAIALTPYPNPPANFGAGLQQAAVARQIFVTGSPAALPDSLLPLAVVSLNAGAIQWLDPYMVRRDTGARSGGARFGLTDPALQHAYLAQYDAQLQAAVAARHTNGLKANFAATDFFQSLPPAGRFPLDTINTGAFSQVFFPQEMDVRLSIVPDDEIAGLFEDSLSLPPIDLTLTPDAYASMGVLALVAVPRDTFAALKSHLPDTPLVPVLPQVLANRSPLLLLRLYQGVTLPVVPPAANTAWASAVRSQTYGYFLRRRTKSTFVAFATPTGVTLTSSANPSVTGQPVIFKATVSPNASTGSVTFLDSQTTLGTSAITAGVATLSFAALTPGLHTLTAQYGGDTNHAADTSGPLAQAVKAAPVITLVSSATPADLQQAVTLTATVVPATATGSVQFLEGTTILGAADIAGGTAAFTTSTLPAGAHTIIAGYSGDANVGAGASKPFVQTVRAVSSVTMKSSSNPSTVFLPFTFTATVIPANATGNVTFRDESHVIDSANLVAGSATINVPFLQPGTHTITAIYDGDGANAGSTSAPFAQTIRNAAKVFLESSPSPSIVQQSVTFTATAQPSTATGSVLFLDGSTELGTIPLDGGIAVLTTANLVVGTHSVTATYSGDAANSTAISGARQQIVKASTKVNLLSSTNPSSLQQAVTFTGTVVPGTATGAIRFLDGTTVLATAPISAGVASFASSALPAGSHTITASYDGDATNGPSISDPLPQNVRTPSSVVLSALPTPSNVQQNVDFTVKLTPNTATGQVQLLDSGVAIASANAINGFANFSIATLTAGLHLLTARYAGDTATSPSSSQLLKQTVRDNAGVTLTSSPNPSNLQQLVTLTATVSPPSATGSVQFLDGTTLLFTGALSVGVVTQTTTTLTAGSHNITASYLGDPSNAPSLSTPTVQVVRAPSIVKLQSSAATSNPLQPVTLTANLTPTSATGSVQFVDSINSQDLGTFAVSGGSASVTVATLGAGSHLIVANYLGDPATMPGSSAGFSQVVKPGATLTLTSSVSPSNPQQTVSFTATVSPKTATGAVQFLDGPTLLGSAPLNGGVAVLPMSTLASGPHTIIATFNGDGTVAAGASVPMPQIVRATAVVTVTSSSSSSDLQQPVILTATVNPKTATGTITFQDGSPLTVPVTLGTGVINGGVATLSIASLAAGQHTIVAVYPGDNNTMAATSQAFPQIVRGATSVTLTATPNPSTVQQSVTFNAVVNPKNATGTLLFQDGPTALGTVVVNGGVGQLTISPMSAGAHPVTVTYGGDNNNSGSASLPSLQLVKVVTSVDLKSSVTPSNQLQPVIFTATVTPATATGNVQFADGTSPLGLVALSGGTASLTVTLLDPGTHSILATYNGDTANAVSVAVPLLQTVKTNSGIVVTSSLTPSNLQQAVVFTARITPTTATGNIQFFDGPTPIASSTLNGGITTVTLTSLTAGVHSISARYAGDANTSAGASQPVLQTVKSPSTIKVTATPSPGDAQQPIVLTAAVNPSSATGNIVFQEPVPGAAAPVTIATAPIVAGVATATLANLAAGTHNITASYAGDAITLPSTSSPVVEIVRPATVVTLILASPNTIPHGTPAVLTARLSAAGATGTIQFKDGAQVVAALPVVVGGVTVVQLANLLPGGHVITAVYTGDANNPVGTSTPVAVIVI